MNRLGLMLGAAAIGAVLLVGCSDEEEDIDPTSTATLPPATSTATEVPTSTDPAPTETATEPAGETVEASITGGLVEDLTLAVGDTVVWTNDDTEAHVLTSDDGAIDSGEIAAGATFEFTFEEAGTWTIMVDDAGDTATITVS